MSTVDEHEKSSKPPARMGRPPVDSEMVRSRLERRLLDRLDAYIAATPEVGTRSDAVRAILAAWLDKHGDAQAGVPMRSAKAKRPRRKAEPQPTQSATIPSAQPPISADLSSQSSGKSGVSSTTLHSPAAAAPPAAYIPTESEIERRAKTIVTSRGGDPDSLDDAGNPRWHRQREQARRDLEREAARR